MLVLEEAGLKKTTQNTLSAMVARDSDNSHDSVDQSSQRHISGGKRPQSRGNSGKNRYSGGGKGRGNSGSGSGGGGKGGGSNNRNGGQQQPPLISGPLGSSGCRGPGCSGLYPHVHILLDNGPGLT
ncbi:glycine-rich RNA-binding protein GRP1A-like [Lycium barbarum]|uniref:glycine-rich RNA-binding protein GRP1A-like n=1 Tax=Lycium barbarum TaxID=112863 RepID=UPI00293E5098|nr:glycine-rich RNA-binding protein GRP1A-like [Lycium barbarum]